MTRGKHRQTPGDGHGGSRRRSAALVALIVVVAAVVISVRLLPLPDRDHGPLCTSAPPTHFCLSHAEAAAGEVVQHVPGVPDSVLLTMGMNLTEPGKPGGIGRSQAEAAVLKDLGHGVTIAACIRASLHSPDGSPTTGQTVWVAVVKPAPGSPDAGQIEIAVVDATNGSIVLVGSTT